MNLQKTLQSLDDFVKNEYPCLINRIKSIDNLKEPIQIKEEIEKYQFPEYLEEFKSLGSSKVNEVASFLDKKIQEIVGNYGEEYKQYLSKLSKKSMGPFEEVFKNRLIDYNSLQKYFPTLNFNKRILQYTEFVNAITSFLELFEEFSAPYCKNEITKDNLQDFSRKVKKQKRTYAMVVKKKATRDTGLKRNPFYVHGLNIIENIETRIIDIYNIRKKFTETSEMIKDSIRNNEFSHTDLESRFTNYENEDFLKKDIEKYKSLINLYDTKKQEYLAELEKEKQEQQRKKEKEQGFALERENIKLDGLREQTKQRELDIEQEKRRDNFKNDMLKKEVQQYKSTNEQLKTQIQKEKRSNNPQYKIIQTQPTRTSHSTDHLEECLENCPEPGSYRLLKLKDILEGRTGTENIFERLNQFSDYLYTIAKPKNPQDKAYITHLFGGLEKDIKEGIIAKSIGPSTYRKNIVENTLNLLSKYTAI